MFDSLLESKARRQPRTGGSIVSIVAHAGLIALAVALTASGQEVAPESPPDQSLIYTKPIEPPPPQAQRPASSEPAAASSPVAAPDVAALITPVVIPDLIPPIVLGREPTPDWNPESLRRAGAAGTGDPSATGTVVSPIGGDAFLESDVDRAVMMAPGSRGPTYPDMLRAAGISGSVLVQFVVDTSGRAELSSLRVLQTDHQGFADAVRRALPGIRFLPAEVRGRRVRQLVLQPFRFNLDR